MAPPWKTLIFNCSLRCVTLSITVSKIMVCLKYSKTILLWSNQVGLCSRIALAHRWWWRGRCCLPGILWTWWVFRRVRYSPGTGGCVRICSGSQWCLPRSCSLWRCKTWSGTWFECVPLLVVWFQFRLLHLEGVCILLHWTTIFCCLMFRSSDLKDFMQLLNHWFG